MENVGNTSTNKNVVIIGAGPAGLTAALELAKWEMRPLVLEKLNTVGGISRTENYKGYYFDMGGHRFFTKSKIVNRIWHEILGDDLLKRPRLSRIYYDRKFFYYPLKPINALMKLGVVQSVLIALSYLRWHLFPYREENTFEQWVTNRFGKRLFETFFKSYTEKVWGIPTSELNAEWAAQRIKDLSLRTVITRMFLKGGDTIKTLIEEFHYPRRGPGMMWAAAKEKLEHQGGRVSLESEVIRINRNDRRIKSVVYRNGNTEHVIEADSFISSMPVTEFIKRLDPPAPSEVTEAAGKLRYRDFLTVCLIVDQPELFPDNWIYIHDPDVRVGRIQNFKNWSPEMVPDQSKTSLGLEYFCNRGDELWTMSDDSLIELGKKEIAQMGLASYDDVLDGCVFRVPYSYPVYDSEYRTYLQVLKDYLEGIENFQTIGRNGLHRYNNQDHAMLTGILAVRNLVQGESNNLWVVNAEEEYHEEIDSEVLEQVEDIPGTFRKVVSEVFTRLDPVAFGISLGLISGLGLLLATLFLVVKGGPIVGPNLQLLDQFLPGYSVTVAGSLVGLLYGFASGFFVGWGSASLRNSVVFLYMIMIERRAELHHLRRFLDYV